MEQSGDRPHDKARGQAKPAGDDGEPAGGDGQPAGDDGEPAGGVGQEPPDDAVRLTAWVRGRVQGVGFRWWTRCRALELGLVGWASNLEDGRVEVVAEGSRECCEDLLDLLREEPPRDPPPGSSRSWYRRPGHVMTVTHQWSAPRGGRGFAER